jgi:hypothetical protein
MLATEPTGWLAGVVELLRVIRVASPVEGTPPAAAGVPRLQYKQAANKGNATAETSTELRRPFFSSGKPTKAKATVAMMIVVTQKYADMFDP